MLGPRQAVYRASSGGVEIQLRMNPDAAGVVIRGPGTESRHIDISGDQVGAVTVRQAWEDYKNKNKEAFARIFTDDAIEVEEGAEGAHDLKATLAEMDKFDLKTCSVSNFHFRPIGSDAMLVRYDVDYTAPLAGKVIHNESIIGEVWEKTAGDWKVLYFQETKTG